MKKRVRAFFLICLLGNAGATAQAGECDCYIGSIASFDFEMRLPEPAGNAMAVARWEVLAAAPRWFSVWAFENAGCANYRKIDAAAFTAAAGDGKLRSGTSSNVAPAGPVKALEYLFSGEITGDEASNTIAVRLETGYSRETVRAASVTFPLPAAGNALELRVAMLTATDTAVRTLAANFQPLATVLREYEQNKRASNTSVACTTSGGSLELKPERLKMVEGETIKVDVVLKDCNDTPLPNREVRFSSGEWPDIGKIPGTTNGYVVPDPVTTDGDGKATVYLSPKEKGTTMLRAWHGHYRPSGHPNVLYKELAISVNQPPQYLVLVSIRHTIFEDREDIRYGSAGEVISERILHNTDRGIWRFNFNVPLAPAIVATGTLQSRGHDGEFQYSRYSRETGYENGQLDFAYIERVEAAPRFTVCPASADVPSVPPLLECFAWLFVASLGGFEIPALPIPLPPGVPAPEMPKQIVIDIPVFADMDRLSLSFSKFSGWTDNSVPIPGPSSIPFGIVMRPGMKEVTWEEENGEITVRYKFSRITEKPEEKYKKEELTQVIVNISPS